MAQHTIDLPCIADTYIDSGNPNTNYGSATLLNAGGERGSSSSYRYYALFKFDWTSLPTRKKVINAKVRLYSAKSMPSVEGCMIGGSVNQRDFNESTVTYNNYGSMPTSYNVYYSGVSLAANTWYEFNFTSDYYSIQHEKFINYGVSFIWTKNHWDENPNFWQIQSREGANPPVLRVTYEDVPPSKPILNEPVGIYASNSSPIRFSWGYISSVGGAQKGFSLQWSTDQDNWTTVNQTTANTYYDMPADTLPAGNIYWRVKTINEYDEESEYSDIAVFYSIGAPGVPVIQSITNNSKPVITWATDNQQVYQVQILQDDAIIHDSGDIPSIQARSYQVPIYLANGTYTVKVRIKNEYDLYSDWGGAEFTINVTQPSKPILTVQRCLYCIEIHVSGTDDKTLIYRSDGSGFICIGQGEWYTDYAVASGVEYEYFARTVNNMGGFADSDIVSMRAELRHNLFAPISNLGDIVVLKYNKDTIPAKAVTLNPMGNTAYYAGRTHAVTEYSEHEESAINFTFFIKEPDVVRRLRELIRKRETVLYRDSRGRKMYGTIYGYSEVDDRLGYQITFALAEVDYNEEVDG